MNDELDRALRSYADVEPRIGIEERVLARVRVDAARRGFPWWSLAWVPVAVVVCWVFLMWRPVVVDAPAGVKARVEIPQVPTIRWVRAVRVKRRELPKPEVFPTPSPVSEEERALQAFVMRDPDRALSVIADLRKKSSEPLEIKALDDGE